MAAKKCWWVEKLNYRPSIYRKGHFSPTAIFEHGLNSSFTLIFSSLLFSSLALTQIAVFGLVLVFTSFADTMIRQIIFVTSPDLRSSDNDLSPSAIKSNFYRKFPILLVFFVLSGIISIKLINPNFGFSYLYVLYIAASLTFSNMRYAMIYAGKQKISGRINYCLGAFLFVFSVVLWLCSIDSNSNFILFIWCLYLLIFALCAYITLIDIEWKSPSRLTFTGSIPILSEVFIFQLISLMSVYFITSNNIEASGSIRLASLIYVSFPQMLVMATSPLVNLNYAKGQLTESGKYWGAMLQICFIIPVVLTIFLFSEVIENLSGFPMNDVNSLAPGVVFQLMSLVILSTLSTFTADRIGLIYYLIARIVVASVVFGLSSISVVYFDNTVFNFLSFFALIFSCISVKITLNKRD
jgi:hypothetical protein